MLDILNKYHEKGLLYKQVHPTLPLTIWNYTPETQYAGKWDEVTIMCRGLVTDDKGNIVGRPFKKFFNIEEAKHTATSEFTVTEKMDGSLIIAFNYEGEWIVASRGSFTSDHAIAADKLFRELNYTALDKNATFLWELIADWNRIVVDYGKENKLVLLGAIYTESGIEATMPELLEVGMVLGGRGHKCEVVKQYDGITDYMQLKNMVEDNHEGFVVHFSNGDRCKIKGEEYIRLHRIMTNISTRFVWEQLREGNDILSIIQDTPDEFYNEITEYAARLTHLYQYYAIKYRKIFNRIKFCTNDIKSFALEAKKYKHNGILFSMNNGKDYSKQIWKIIEPEYRKL